MCSDMYRYLDMYRSQIIFKSKKEPNIRPKSAEASRTRNRVAEARADLKSQANALRGVENTNSSSEEIEIMPSRPTSARLTSRMASPSVNPTLVPELGTSAEIVIPSPYTGIVSDIGPVTNKVIGNKASGSMSSWVDLLAAKHKAPAVRPEGPSKFPKASDPKYTSPKLIEKRKDIVRKRSDKQWHEELRFGDNPTHSAQASSPERDRRHIGASFQEFDHPETFLGHTAPVMPLHVEERTEEEDSIVFPTERSHSER